MDDVAFQAGDAGSSADDAGADVVVCDDFDGVELASSAWNAKIGGLERSDADPETPSPPFALDVVLNNGSESEITLALPSDERTIWLEAALRVVSPGAGGVDVLQVKTSTGDFTVALIFDTAQNKWLLQRSCVGLPGCFLLQDTNSTFDTWKHVKLEVSRPEPTTLRRAAPRSSTSGSRT